MKSHSFSSNVDLTLIVAGEEIPLSHVGSQSVIVQGKSQSRPSGIASIIVTVDGVQRAAEIFLPHGIPDGDSPRVKYF